MSRWDRELAATALAAMVVVVVVVALSVRARHQRRAPIVAPSMGAAPAPSSLDSRSAGANDEFLHRRRVLARLQSDLERVAAGRPVSVVPAGLQRDELEGMVEAYRAALERKPEAIERVRKLDHAARARLYAAWDAAEKEWNKDAWGRSETPRQRWTKYTAQIDSALRASEQNPMQQLAAVMRLVDAALLLEANAPYFNLGYDLFERLDDSFGWKMPESRDGVWLRLPCRTVIGRREAFEAVYARLGKAAGPLLNCPMPMERSGDFAAMERFAANPGAAAPGFVNHPKPPQASDKPAPSEPREPPKPWKRQAAVEFMDRDPDAAEPALRAAIDPVGKLDYALFLHAFRKASPARDRTIQRLAAEVVQLSVARLKKDRSESVAQEFELQAYDGTDESLLSVIVIGSLSHAVNSWSAFYAIPCGVLVARPGLLAATRSRYGGNMDNFLPRSGCAWGRGAVRGFPDAQLAAYQKASEEADGHFFENFSGSMRYGLAAVLNEQTERVRVDPRGVLQLAPAHNDQPYETWSYLSLHNREVYGRVRPVAESLRDKLTEHFVARGLSQQDAATAARRALFEVVWGADCGQSSPPRTLRRLLIDRAPIEELRAFLKAGAHHRASDSAPFRLCGRTMDDPLMHIAVGYPASLPVLWELARDLPDRQAEEADVVLDPNAPNFFRKTPLMSAAQADQVESARWLLEHGAQVNAETFAPSQQLKHDGRTALMYAAQRGSLGMIQLLLHAGADAHQADTMMLTPLHYLLGYGPAGRNPKIDSEELGAAAALLM